MSSGRTSWRASFLWALGLTAYLASGWLGFLNTPTVGWAEVFATLAQGFAMVGVGVVGWLIASRRPQNPIGWIYLGCWLGGGALALANTYGRWATVTRPGAPVGETAVWLMNWAFVPVIGTLVTYPLLLFPDGHLPTPRWRKVAWATGAVIVLWSVSFALSGADYTDAQSRSAANPYTSDSIVGFFDISKVVLAVTFVALVIAMVVSLVVRFRRGSELERAQLKWLILAGVASVLFLMLPSDHGNGDWVDILGGLVWALLPISVGIAILRYRLYEIDRIISRTVTYTAVIVILVGVYLAIVGSLSVVLPENGAPAVAAATLAAAALFRPLLSLVKVRVDRRFNRSRYDARITADEFAQRVRDGSDTDAVEADLVSSVTRAMEPSQVSLWIRQP